MIFEILVLFLGIFIVGLAVAFAIFLKKNRDSASSNVVTQLKAENVFLRKDKQDLFSEGKKKEERILQMTETLSRLETEKELANKVLADQQKNFEEVKQKFHWNLKNSLKIFWRKKQKSIKPVQRNR
ncbi:MAG: hypothetical protein OXB86_05950 [Bdellovibrionales bacterium]|nr:hypothetical protein [Bdellovibrionales bacterium]